MVFLCYQKNSALFTQKTFNSSKKKLNSNNTLCSRLHGQFKKPRTLGSGKFEVS